MYRISAVVVVCVAGILLWGCGNENKKTVRETGWGTGAWGQYEEMQGENTPEIKSAVTDLKNSGDTATKVGAANRLGEMRISTNLAIEALEDGMKEDQPMDVRLACARALSLIGSSSAIHHLHDAEDSGYVPVYRDYSVLDKYGKFNVAAPVTARETTTVTETRTGTVTKTGSPCDNVSSNVND
jgi:hypothetical protein